MSGTNGSWKRVEKLPLRFRTPRGRRQIEGGEEKVRETRVTRPVTEFPDRPLLDDPPSGNARRQDPILAKWSERLCIEPLPSSGGQRSATDCLSFVSGVTTCSTDGGGNRRVRGSPAGDGNASKIADGEKRPSFRN